MKIGNPFEKIQKSEKIEDQVENLEDIEVTKEEESLLKEVSKEVAKLDLEKIDLKEIDEKIEDQEIIDVDNAATIGKIVGAVAAVAGSIALAVTSDPSHMMHNAGIVVSIIMSPLTAEAGGFIGDISGGIAGEVVNRVAGLKTKFHNRYLAKHQQETGESPA